MYHLDISLRNTYMYLPFRNGEQIYVETYERKDTIYGNRTDYWQPYIYLGYIITPYLQIYDNVDETQKYLKKVTTQSTTIVIKI